MNKKEIFKKIGGIISELTEQYQYLSQNLDDVNDLEFELFVANANFLTDHIEILRKLNATSGPANSESLSGLPPIQESVTFKVREEESASEQSSVIESSEAFIKESSEEPDESTTSFFAKEERPEENFVPEAEPEFQSIESAGTIVNQADDVSYNNTFEKDAAIEVPETVAVLESFQRLEALEKAKPVPTQPTGTLSDAELTDVSANNTFEQAAKLEAPEIVRELKSFPPTNEVEENRPTLVNREELRPATSALVPTINDLISAQRKPLAESPGLNGKPIADLKAGINLNDKLLFIKDLFNGYSLAYSEAIELLNRFDSFDTADKFLQTNYAQKNNWQSKQATMDKFYNILKRRFAK